MTRSENIDHLAAALALAQGSIQNAAKDSANPYFGSKYADLAPVWDAIRKPPSENGLAIVQPVAVDGSEVTVITLLAHSSGQWISSELRMTAQRQLKDGGGWEKLDTPQAVGSVITYARRYALAAPEWHRKMTMPRAGWVAPKAARLAQTASGRGSLRLRRTLRTRRSRP